jgi:hypothetical protein
MSRRGIASLLERRSSSLDGHRMVHKTRSNLVVVVEPDALEPDGEALYIFEHDAPCALDAHGGKAKMVTRDPFGDFVGAAIERLFDTLLPLARRKRVFAPDFGTEQEQRAPNKKRNMSTIVSSQEPLQPVLWTIA